MTPYQQGHYDVMAQLGIEKIAIAVGTSSLDRAGGWIKEKVPKAVSFIGRTLFGQPKKFLEEAGAGKAFSKGSLIRQGIGGAFSMKGPLSLAMNYGLPAYKIYNIMKAGPGERAEQVGGLAGGTVLGAALGKPFGMVGSMVGNAVGSRAGSALARLGKKVTGQDQPAEQQQTAGQMAYPPPGYYPPPPQGYYPPQPSPGFAPQYQMPRLYA